MHRLLIFKAAFIFFFFGHIEAATQAVNATVTFTGREQH